MNETLEQIFEKPFEKVSIKELAAYAEMTNQTFIAKRYGNSGLIIRVGKDA